MQFTRIKSWISMTAKITPPRAGPRIDVVESISLLIEFSLRRLSGLTRFGLAASNVTLNMLEKILRRMVVRYMVDRFSPQPELILKSPRNRNPLARSIPTMSFFLEILSARTPATGLIMIIGRI